jgi:hypothetical protein
MSVTFQDLFLFAMKRSLPRLQCPVGMTLDLGSSGKYQVPGAVSLGLPAWRFPQDNIPAQDETVSLIHCYHFLEHLSGDDAIELLREVERVLIPGGVMNYCMPYYNSNLMAQDLTHKSFWNEDSFRNLFENDYYNPAGTWNMQVHFQVIAGIAERNLALIGQLVKVPR